MIFAFRLTLTDEAQQLPKVMPKFAVVRISTPTSNSGEVYLGNNPVNVGAASTRFAIAANKNFPLKISDLGLLWASGIAADVLDLLCEIEGGANEQSNSK